ncbi:MAG: response regulator [Pirellulales bacterium]|nr:response regulator [Pirellulales bacterium]
MAETVLKVLLVEDDADHAEMVKAALAKADLTSFDLTHVDCLAAAHEILATCEYDAILLDLGLPDALGLEALSQIRRQCPETAIVVLTSNSNPSVGIETATMGADDYVYKGYMNAPTLERVLRHVIQRQQVLLEVRRANESLDRKNAELLELNRLLDQRNEELRETQCLLDRKNQRLTQMYEMGQQFVDNVSHDFRTPLTVIKEYVGIVCDGLAGEVSEKQRQFLGIVNDRADDLALMVDDMLDRSRLDAGLMNIWRRETRISDVFEHARPTLERKAVVKEVTLKISADEDLPVVYCDPDKIGRVIVNLVMNAVKFCAKGGEVSLQAHRATDGPEVIIEVADDGPGISPENLQRVFERFRQAEGTHRLSGDGFGLGLNIARELVHLNLGEIDVRSKPDKGSVFSFNLPAWNPEELVSRYLKRVDRSQPAGVSLLVATVDTPIERTVSHVVDEFLQHTFRGSDLVLQIQLHKWLVLAQCPRDEITKMLDRVQSAWAENNRSMPEVKIPKVKFSVRDTWSATAPAEDVLRQCQSELALAVNEPAESRILLVDDDHEFVQGLEIRLRASGYEVMTAFDGLAAVDLAVEHHPDAIVMDNYMPVMSGLETLDELGKHTETMEVPVIMLSASTRDRQQALERGVCFFLQKPCDSGTLAAALREVIAEPFRAGLD